MQSYFTLEEATQTSRELGFVDGVAVEAKMRKLHVKV